ncbi:MAG: antitoxin MazE-like protein [Rhodopila sp.]
MKTCASSRERIARYRAAQRKRGSRPVLLWLPNVNDPDYRARLADECRQLAHPTPEEDALMADFASLAVRTEGWQ